MGSVFNRLSLQADMVFLPHAVALIWLLVASTAARKCTWQDPCGENEGPSKHNCDCKVGLLCGDRARRTGLCTKPVIGDELGNHLGKLQCTGPIGGTDGDAWSDKDYVKTK